MSVTRHLPARPVALTLIFALAIAGLFISRAASEPSASDVIEYKGTVVAAHEVEIAPRFDGIITKIHFVPGQLVNRGDLLFEFMTLEKELLLDADRARQQRAEAELRRAEAVLKGTQALRARNVGSARQLLEAEVAKDMAAASAAEAAVKVRMSELILREMKLYAPVTGMIGRPLMAEGTNIKLGAREQSALAQITELDPIRVLARVPSDEYFRRRTLLKTDAQVMKQVELTLILPNGDKYLHVGRIIGGGHEFDPASQTIANWAEFPNPGHLLRPGLSVTLQSRIKPDPK